MSFYWSCTRRQNQEVGGEEAGDSVIGGMHLHPGLQDALSPE